MSKNLDDFKTYVSKFFNSEEKVADVELAEDEVKEAKVDEPKVEVQEPQAVYATAQELSQLKSEMMEMFKALLEENKKDLKEVPQELSKQELSKQEEVNEVELSEGVEEIIHSPENEVKKERVEFSKPFGAMTIQERINEILNNN